MLGFLINIKVFKKYIRRFNGLMAFGSLGGKFNTAPGSSAQFLNLHGQLYHRVSSLEPDSNKPRKYAQLYMVDTDLALAQRLEQFDNMSSNYHPSKRERPIVRNVENAHSPHNQIHDSIAIYNV